MKSLCFLWIFILGLSCSYRAFAVKCYLCGDETQSLIQCGKLPAEEAKNAGEDEKCHEICTDCLVNQVGSELGDGHDLHEGLKCFGENARCKQKYEIEAVKTALSGTQALDNLNTSLEAQEALGADPSSEAMKERQSPDSEASEESKVDPVQELQNQIQEAFNLECPGLSDHPKAKNTGNRISGILAPIEGCNAATCDVCNARFCYLCLNSEPDSKAAHAHARAHSDNYWENRDGHTGWVPDRTQGQDYLEYEEYSRKEKITIRGSKGKHPGTAIVIEKGKPYTYTDRYHWEIVREKLEVLFKSGNVQPDQEAVAQIEAVVRLKALLKEKKMWPFPVGKKPGQWAHEAREYFTQEMEAVKNATLSLVERSKKLDLLKRNWIALLQNEYIFQYRIAKHEKSNEELKEAAQTHAETVKGVLLSFKAPLLTSLDASQGQAGGGNVHITPLLEDHEDERIRNLVEELQKKFPRFFELGGEDGRIYLIEDPEDRVEPFILSDQLRGINQESLPMTHKDAMRACPEGSQPPSKAQLKALIRAMSPGGRYDPNTLPGMAGAKVWSSSVRFYYHPVSARYFGDDGAFYLMGDAGHIFEYDSDYPFLVSVRCVRAAW